VVEKGASEFLGQGFLLVFNSNHRHGKLPSWDIPPIQKQSKEKAEMKAQAEASMSNKYRNKRSK